MQTLMQRLAELGARFPLHDVSADDGHDAKLLVLDLFGVAIAGLKSEEARLAPPVGAKLDSGIFRRAGANGRGVLSCADIRQSLS